MDALLLVLQDNPVVVGAFMSGGASGLAISRYVACRKSDMEGDSGRYTGSQTHGRPVLVDPLSQITSMFLAAFGREKCPPRARFWAIIGSSLMSVAAVLTTVASFV